MTYAPLGSTCGATALGTMPSARRMTTLHVGHSRASVRTMFDVVRAVEAWPTHLPHYRSVRMLERDPDGGGVVEMVADRPFGAFRWPTVSRSVMQVDHRRPAVRFRHIGGLTTGMEVEWAFEADGLADGRAAGTRISLLHLWDGPRWPLIGAVAAVRVIGPLFVTGMASRTLVGLVRAAEAVT